MIRYVNCDLVNAITYVNCDLVNAIPYVNCYLVNAIPHVNCFLVNAIPHVNCYLVNAIPYVNFENTRRHHFNIVHTFTQIRLKKHFIFNRIVNIWNRLPDNTDIIKSFVNRISTCMF